MPVLGFVGFLGYPGIPVKWPKMDKDERMRSGMIVSRDTLEHSNILRTAVAETVGVGVVLYSNYIVVIRRRAV